MQEPLITTRRDFLRTTLLGGALSWTVPSFVANTFSSLHASAEGSLTQVTTGKDGPILILIQLAGGNDGLNTVIPYANDFYHQARPTIGYQGSEVLKINDHLGFNPNLAGFKSLYDAGQLAVINGVGYPNPNRSHFRSTEIWSTASDENRFLTDGWIGRYFDNACSGCDPTVGVSIGERMPQAFASHNPTGVSLDNPESYRFMGAGLKDDEETAYRNMYGTAGPGSGGLGAGDSVSMLSGTVTLNNGQSALDFLERTSMDAQVSSDKIRDIAGKVKNMAPYPTNGFANNLKLVARLIAGGLPTRVFYVSQGGYDTHTNQRGAQESRLKELGDSLKSFTDDLKAMGEFQRVTLMTFSEFGRRVMENGSHGTDHGTAAPMFIIGGGKLQTGVVGTHPSLDPKDLDEGDLKFNTDFRSVYATLLQDWLKTPSVPILGRQFDKLSLIG